MIVTVQASPDSEQTARRHAAVAERAHAALADVVHVAATVGADTIAELMQRGQLNLTPQHGGQGLAGSVMAWMVDASLPMAALGVPSDSPAARYAAILNFGGVITPKAARALAVPVSPEAKRFTSPRDMADLQLMTRPGKPPLLIRAIGRRIEVHWVLLASVRMPAFGWFTLGTSLAKGPMITAAQDKLDEFAAGFSGGRE